jgi:hypothetical protein
MDETALERLNANGFWITPPVGRALPPPTPFKLAADAR